MEPMQNGTSVVTENNLEFNSSCLINAIY